MTLALTILRSATIPLLLFTTACGSSTSTPWADGTAVIRGSDGDVREIPWSEVECLPIEGGGCLNPDEACGGKGAADVYVDAAGNVVEVICYPPGGDETTVVALEPDAAIGNGDIVVVSGTAQAPAYSGDLDLTTNNNTLYGDDPGTSIIAGNVEVNGNNTLVSGVTVTGNLRVVLNDTQLTNCVIRGNLIIEGNNTKAAGCIVDGNIEITGQNTELTNNVVDGNIENAGQNTVCTGNYRGFNPETGETLTCE